MPSTAASVLRRVPARLVSAASAAVEARGVVPIAIVNSGGVSWGSFQAGAAWAFVRAMKRNAPAAYLGQQRYLDALKSIKGDAASAPDYELLHLTQSPLMELVAATGASAGSINALVAAMTWCAANLHEAGPSDSVFWNSWVPVGVDDLLPTRRIDYKSDDALLTRAALSGTEAGLVAALSARHYGPCRVPVALTLTSTARQPLGPFTKAAGGSSLRHVSLLEAQSQAGSALALIPIHLSRLARGAAKNGVARALHAAARSALAPVTVGTGSAASIPPKTVTAWLRATSAFPGAFGYVTLDYCSGEPKDSHARAVSCPHKTATARFYDGGVFDNMPFGLAMALWGDEAVADHLRVFGPPSNRVQQVMDLGARTPPIGSAASSAASPPGASATPSAASAPSAPAGSTSSGGPAAPRVIPDEPPAQKSVADRWEAAEIAGALEPSQRLRVVYFDPSKVAGQPEKKHIASKGLGTTYYVETLLPGVINSGSSYEYQLLDRLELGKFADVRVAKRYGGAMGVHLMSFGAFLARSFREYDYILGAYAGMRAFASQLCGQDDTRVLAAAVYNARKRCTLRLIRLQAEDLFPLTAQGTDENAAINRAARSVMASFLIRTEQRVTKSGKRRGVKLEPATTALFKQTTAAFSAAAQPQLDDRPLLYGAMDRALNDESAVSMSEVWTVLRRITEEVRRGRHVAMNRLECRRGTKTARCFDTNEAELITHPMREICRHGYRIIERLGELDRRYGNQEMPVSLLRNGVGALLADCYKRRAGSRSGFYWGGARMPGAEFDVLEWLPRHLTFDAAHGGHPQLDYTAGLTFWGGGVVPGVYVEASPLIWQGLPAWPSVRMMGGLQLDLPSPEVPVALFDLRNLVRRLRFGAGLRKDLDELTQWGQRTDFLDLEGSITPWEQLFIGIGATDFAHSSRQLTIRLGLSDLPGVAWWLTHK